MSQIKVDSVVEYKHHDKSKHEYGIVIQTYWNKDDLICFVAFWGDYIPTMDETKPPTKNPYIIECKARNLKHVEGLERDLTIGIWKFNGEK